MEWRKQIEALSKIATSELRAAYAAFAFGHHYTYYMTTMLNIPSNSQKLEVSSRSYCFIRTSFSAYECNDLERQLVELSTKYESLGLINPSKISYREYRNNRKLSKK